jgi:hypothetical protein
VTGPQKEPIRTRAVPWKTSLADQVAGQLGEPPAYVKRLVSLERSVDSFFALAGRRHAVLFKFVELRRKELVAVEGHARREKRARAVVEGTIVRCNARWQKWLDAEGRFDGINAQIKSFNRNYVSERIAALKYVPHFEVLAQEESCNREPVGPRDVFERYPFAPTAATA